MTPEELGSDLRETVWEMSRMTNKILIFGIILILAILAVLMYCGILTFPSGIRIQAAQLLGDRVLWAILLLRQPLYPPDLGMDASLHINSNVKQNGPDMRKSSKQRNQASTAS